MRNEIPGLAFQHLTVSCSCFNIILDSLSVSFIILDVQDCRDAVLLIWLVDLVAQDV